MLTAEGWHPFLLAFYRGSIGLIFVLVWLLLRPTGSGLANRRLWFWAGIAGLGVAGNFTFYFISIAEGSVAVAATLMYCAPVYVFLVSFALKLEVSTPFKWAAVLVVILGVVLLTRIYDVGAAAITPVGVAAGLLSGMCYAIFIFGFKFATPHGSPQAILVIAFTVLITILIWPSDLNQAVAALKTPNWPFFLALGVFGAGLSFILYVVGIEGTRPTTASIVAMIEPITASLFAVAIMNESLAGLQLVGMGMILLTATAMSIHSNT